MTPIISPLMIYMVGVIDNLQAFLIIVLVLLGFATVFALVAGLVEDDENFIKIGKQLGILAVIISIVFTIIPSKKTIVGMVVAKNMTYERVELLADKTDQYIDRLINYVLDESKKK